MNSNAKGYRSERKTVAYLEAKGWIVDTTKRSSYRGQNDFFNRYDHVAVCIAKSSVITFEMLDLKKPVPVRFRYGDVLFVQTKSNRLPPPEERERLFNFPGMVMIVVWKDRSKTPRLLGMYNLIEGYIYSSSTTPMEATT